MSRASISMESRDFFVRQKREVKEPMDCFDSPIQFSREIALRKLLPPAAARLLRVRLKLWLGIVGCFRIHAPGDTLPKTNEFVPSFNGRTFNRKYI